MRYLRTPYLLLAVFMVMAPALLSACDVGVVTPGTSSTSGQGAPTGQTGAGTGGSITPLAGGAVPVDAPKPAPPQTNYNGCPAQGDGGDAQLNVRKNRTDSATWYPVSVAGILAIQWPRGIEQRQRSSWSSSDAAEIARYEGTPVQVEGYLAGAKQQGPESCNCHSVDDVDNHLWVVAQPGTDRTQSVVAEITPRVRAMHPGWAFDRVHPLANGRTKVRISGWLMMDQEHPDQVGKTRGTIWEIHPIMNIEVESNGAWVPLDQGGATSGFSGSSQAPPTEDPSLPPPITDPMQGVTLPTATPRARAPHSGGLGTSSGTTAISDIFYNGAINPTEPDEYVEISNRGGQAVNMDGWSLKDVYGGQTFTWHNYTLGAGQSIRVYTNQVHPESGGFSFGSAQAIWNNQGDAAELLDAGGNVVSTFAYGAKR